MAAGGWTATRTTGRLSESWCPSQTDSDSTVSSSLQTDTEVNAFFLSPLNLLVCLTDISYHIAVKTGNIPGGSSDSNVFVKLYGEKGDTSKMMLVVSTNNLGNYFETGRIDIFTVETCDIGQVTRRRPKLDFYLYVKLHSDWE